MDLAGVPPRQAAYLAQQAAEKALKATIAHQGGEPPLRHDLLFLLDRSPGDARLRDIPVDLVALSAAHTAARYPQVDDTPYDPDEVGPLVMDASRLVVGVQEYFDRLGLAGTDLAPL